MKTIVLFLTMFACVTSYAQTYSSITYDAGTSIDIGVGADVCADNIIINGTYSGGGTICDGPLPVTLVSFESRITKNDVKLIWVTENEINNSGFDIERTRVIPSGVEGWQKIGFIQGNGSTTSQIIYTYEDKKLQSAIYKYRLKQIDYNGNYEYFNLTNSVQINPPKDFSISQNYPNPSNPKSKINFEMPVDGRVTIKIYDILGREAATLLDEIKAADFYTVEFDGTNLASGIYFYRMTVNEFSETRKMILVK